MVKYLLFDMDDTLYQKSTGLMVGISDRMNEFMRTRLGIAESEVAGLRQFYWQRYGTTLRGLYLERHIDAQAFLDFVHDVPVEQYLHADAALEAMLGQLAPAKFIFTNAPANYARRVLTTLGVEKHFAGIFDINFIDYESKPTPSAYHKVLSALAARGDECLMVDDSARNLAPAKALGMQTVLLDGTSAVSVGELPEGVDEIITSIYDFPRVSLLTRGVSQIRRA